MVPFPRDYCHSPSKLFPLVAASQEDFLSPQAAQITVDSRYARKANFFHSTRWPGGLCKSHVAGWGEPCPALPYPGGCLTQGPTRVTVKAQLDSGSFPRPSSQGLSLVTVPTNTLGLEGNVPCLPRPASHRAVIRACSGLFLEASRGKLMHSY